MTELLDPLLRTLRTTQGLGLDYVELRAEETSQAAIEVRDGTVEVLSQRTAVGHSARVLKGGRWGFASTDGMKDVTTTLGAAAKAASSIPTKDESSALSLSHEEPVTRAIKCTAKTPFGEVALEDKFGFLKALCRNVVSGDKRMTTCKASYRDVAGSKVLVTNGGTCVEYPLNQVYITTTGSGKETGRPVSVRDEVCTVTDGWELLDKHQTEAVIGSRLVTKAKRQLDGVACRRGTFPCVLSPRVAGMLAHEALGHLSEADLYASGAFSGQEGTRLAPRGVTIVDSPVVNGGFGNIELDDEGVPPTPVVLIRDGVLADQMTNREWASKLGCQSSGNARAESYRVPPLIRMRNTYFERGTKSFEELLEGKKFGYYCVDVRGGQAEANSSFQVGIPECFEIRKGEIAGPVRSLAISGVALDSLKKIDGIGLDFGLESSYCGKMDQDIPTSDGGPHLSIGKGAIVFGGSE